MISAALAPEHLQPGPGDERGGLDRGAALPQFHQRRDAVDADVHRSEGGVIVIAVASHPFGYLARLTDQVPRAPVIPLPGRSDSGLQQHRPEH
jgi:hypothetical protein